MGKNKFIDKKKAATFHLLARESSGPSNSAGAAEDHVFVRVDNNPYAVQGLSEDQQPDDAGSTDDPNSIFADALGDYDEEDTVWYGSSGNPTRKEALPEHTRREIIELGFPDDGYNYLTHLREIRNAGGGSMYYQNPKATFEQLKPDVKAYNASRIDISKVDDEEGVYNVVPKTADARVEKVVDDEVAALLDDSGLSRFGSDVEDLEEDFVLMANLPEGPVDLEMEKKTVLEKKSNLDRTQDKDFHVAGGTASDTIDDENPRLRRPLDEHFDRLLLQEYGSDSEDGYEDCDVPFDESEESLAEKLNSAFKYHSAEGVELEDKSMVPSNILHAQQGLDHVESLEDATDVIARCKEYAEKYENENEDDNQEIFDESSDESELWDCETIVSTYSNLDNHPGKIEAPEMRRKKKLAEVLSGALSSDRNIISLRGKEKLPVDILSRAQRNSGNKISDAKDPKPEHKRKQHGQESKEEKKERKAAVKEEKREARRVKKEMKGLYKCEAQRAQRVAASTGPSSIHLM